MASKKACVINLMILLVVCACGRQPDDSSELFGESSPIGRNFSYTLLTNDIFPWVDGRQEGLVGSDKRKHARFVEKLINSARSDIMLGLYGVQDQPWFFSALDLRESQTTNFVVDQQAGALNQWLPENFTYPDTAKLGKKVGAEHITPDLNPSGSPRSSSIMHDKFLVLKNKGVWTGSTNISATCLGTEYNANASIYIPGPEVAAIFEDEFRQMFDEGRFSIYKEMTGPKALRFKDGTRLEVFFSPQDRPVEKAIIPFIRSAKSTLDIAMFVLSHPEIISEIEAAAKRGVKVRLLVDALFAARDTSPVQRLRNSGVDVRIENWGGKMHMKSAVADGTTSVIGSMNWTEAGGNQNDENTMIIKNPGLAAGLSAHYSKLWKLLDKIGVITPAAESQLSVNSCFDGIDNDYDGVIDADEPLCSSTVN